MSDEAADPERAAGPPPTPPVPKRRRRWPFVVVGALVVLAIAARALLPTALERGAAWMGPRQIGVPVRLENADLALWRGEAVLEGLVVGGPGDPGGETGPDPERALLRWDRLGVRIDWGSLLRGRIHLRELSLGAPLVRIPLDERGRLILPELPADPEAESAEPPPEAEAESGAGWPIQLDALELTDLELRLVQEGEADPVDFLLASFRLEDLVLADGEVGLGGIALTDPELRVRRDFVFSEAAEVDAEEAEEVAAEMDAEEAEEVAAEETGLDALSGHRVASFVIDDAHFGLLIEGEPVEISLSIRAEDISAQRDTPFPVEVAMGVDEGSISIDGRLGVNPITWAGTVAWSDLPLVPLARAASPELAPWLRAGIARGELEIDARVGGADAGVTASGSLGLAGLDVRNPGDADEVAVAFEDLDVGVSEVRWPLADAPPEAGRVALERVTLRGPRLLYTQPAPSLDALAGSGGEEPAEDAEETEAEAPEPTGADEPEATGTPLPTVAVATLEVDGGRITFRDRSLDPPYETELRDLSVRARDVRWPEPRARGIRVGGAAHESGTFRLTGVLEDPNGDFEFRLDRLALPPFNPYAQSAAGYRIGSGEASITTDVEMRGPRYQIDSDVVLHQLSLDGGDGGFAARFGMPLDVALALMRDLDGDIHLPVNVRIVPEARTELTPIVVAALRQAITGALASPLKLAGFALDKVTGGGEGGLGPLRLDFAPGSAALPEEAEDRLASWEKLLSTRPTLGLAVAGEAGPADRDALAERILIERVAADASLPEVEDDAFFARRRVRSALEARGSGEAGELEAEDAALLERYVAAVEVPDVRYRALAEARGEAVRTALEARGAEAGRVTAAEPRTDVGPGVRVELRAAAP